MKPDELIADLISRTDDAFLEIADEWVRAGRMMFYVRDVAERVEHHMRPGYPVPAKEILMRFARVKVFGYPAGWCCYCAYSSDQESCPRPPPNDYDIGDRFHCDCGCERSYELRRSILNQFRREPYRSDPPFWASLDPRPVSKPLT